VKTAGFEHFPVSLEKYKWSELGLPARTAPDQSCALDDLEDNFFGIH